LLLALTINVSGWGAFCHLHLRFVSHWVPPFSSNTPDGPSLNELLSLEIVIWKVPSLIGGAIAVSIVGALLGPIYPIMMNQASLVLPSWLLTGSVGWIAGFGQAGSAALPFITGVIASNAGIKVLQPV